MISFESALYHRLRSAGVCQIQEINYKLYRRYNNRRSLIDIPYITYNCYFNRTYIYYQTSQ